MNGDAKSVNAARLLVAAMGEDIGVLRRGGEARREAVSVLKHRLLMQDEQVAVVIGMMGGVKTEIKTIKAISRPIKMQNKSIKREEDVLSERVRELSEKLERRIDARRKSAMATALRGEVGQKQVQSTQAAGAPGSVVACCDDWLIEMDVGRTDWVRGRHGTCSGTFTGARGPYTFQLGSMNYIPSGELCIYLCIRAGPGDSLLAWPFRGAVTVTVAHRDSRELCCRETRQCRIGRPRARGSRCSDLFIFQHAQLRGVGLDLERGVRVSCQIESATAR